MSLSRCAILLVSVLLLSVFSLAQLADRTVTCQFEDGKAISIRYQPLPQSGQTIPTGRVWSPGDSPMFLFTDTPLTLSSANLEVRAYSLYVIVGNKHEPWTLIINKNVDPKAKYDPAQDLVRVPMEIGELPTPRRGLDVILGRTAPKQCNLRIYSGKVGAFGPEFKEK